MVQIVVRGSEGYSSDDNKDKKGFVATFKDFFLNNK
jgi:hypothetical protein